MQSVLQQLTITFAMRLFPLWFLWVRITATATAATIKTTPTEIPPAKAPTGKAASSSSPVAALISPVSCAKGHKCRRLTGQNGWLKIEIVNLYIGHGHSSHSDILERGWIGIGIICAMGIQDKSTHKVPPPKECMTRRGMRYDSRAK